MLLPEKILDALIDDTASGIRFFCTGKEKQKEVAKFFVQCFDANLAEQKKQFEEDLDSEPDEVDVESFALPPQYHEKYVTVPILPLDLHVNMGVRAYNEYGTDAFDQAVKEFHEKYPDIRYDGCIQYAWYDEHCGDTVSWEFGDKDTVYDFVGQKLEISIADGILPEELDYTCDSDDKEELLQILDTYSDYLSDSSKEAFRQAVEDLE